ncbi:MAG: hypothetical protein Q8880_03515 [Bacteroidota bacterium]|nr:hypothetical protein [Bacteroidota bacterium]
MKTLFLITFIFNLSFLFAQDTITLMNGKEISTSGIRLIDNQIFYCTDKAKEKCVSKDKVFIVKFCFGEENIIYKTDSSNDEFFNVEQMRKYIQGEIYARKHFKGNLSLSSGFGWGIIGGVGYGYLGSYSILIPAFGTAVTSSFSNKNQQDIINPLQNDEFFLLGYNEAKKNIKFKRAILGGILGYLVCILYYF